MSTNPNVSNNLGSDDNHDSNLSHESTIDRQTFEETRKVVDAFLKRSLLRRDDIPEEGHHNHENGESNIGHNSKSESGLQKNISNHVKYAINQDEFNNKPWEFPERDDINSTVDSSNSNIVMKLLDSVQHSSDSNSISSVEDGRPKMRRKSFESAVRKSVISYLERKKKAEKSFEAEPETPFCEVNNIGRLQHDSTDPSPSLNRSFSEKPDLQASSSFSHHSHSKSDTTNADLEVHPSTEKKPSFRRKIRNLVQGSSMKRKQQKLLQRQEGIVDENELKRSGEYQMSDIFNQDNSPKLKRKPPDRDFLHPGISDFEKGGSLPSFIRLTAGVTDNGDARRYSEFGLDRIDKGHSHPGRPKDLDLTSDPRKKRKISKLRKRLLKFGNLFRKRSESSVSSSSSSSRSSIPDAVMMSQEVEDQVQKGGGGDYSLTNGSKTDEKNASEDGILDGGKKHSKQSSHHLVGKISDKPYQHRGSLSFSHGDLDNLSAPEKQKIYEEIALTLERISRTYSRLTSRSSNPSSRMETPDSSLSRSDYFHQFKGTEDLKSREGSRRSSIKKFRPYNDSDQEPAMKAYLNIQHSKSFHQHNNRSKTYKASYPSSIPKRRHTHHAMTGSLDSPIREHHTLPSSRTDDNDQAYDVVDGLANAIAEGLSSSSDDQEDSNIQTNFVAPHEDPESYGTNVDCPGPSRIPTGSHFNPSTSRNNTRGNREGSTSSQNGMDEDKLVELLVQALISKGDQFARSMNAPEEEQLRRRVVAHLSTTSYAGFQSIAHRFTESLQRLGTETATRHPDVMPVVMAFNMTKLVIDFATSETARDVIVDYSYRYIDQIVRSIGSSWYTMLSFLRETEEDLENIEDRLDEVSPPSSSNPPFLYSQSRNQTDDELD